MMGFKAVISKKSTNKSTMIAERFSNWLKEKEQNKWSISFQIILNLLLKWK